MTIKSVYPKFESAFSNVRAYAVFKDGAPVAKIVFKFPRNGASALPVFVHFMGLRMVKGVAKGYGYDKKTAACIHAAETLRKENANETNPDFLAFVNALSIDDGYDFARNLEKSGFLVFQVV
jgi:hypothetical protein